MKRLKLSMIVLSALLCGEMFAQWSGGTTARWVGTNTTNIKVTALSTDKCGNKYVYLEPASIQVNQIKVGMDTVDCGEWLIKLDGNNELIWKLNFTSTAPSFAINKILVDSEGSVFVSGVGGPSVAKDTTVPANDLLINKAFFLPNTNGEIDTVRIKYFDKRYASNPFLIKYTKEGMYVNMFCYAGLNSNVAYDMVMHEDTVYFAFKGHATQGVLKINATDFSQLWLKTIASAWQNASFFGSMALNPSAKRIYVAIPYSGTLNNFPGVGSLTGATQGYVVSFNTTDGNFNTGYKKLNSGGFNTFNDISGSKKAPEMLLLNDSMLYFNSYCLRGSLVGVSVGVDGLSFTKEVTAQNTPLYMLGIAKITSADTLQFTVLNKVEPQTTTNFSSMEVKTALINNENHIVMFSYGGATQSVVYSGDATAYGASAKAKVLKMDGTGTITYLDGSTGGANEPSSACVYVDQANNLYIAGTYYSSNVTFGSYLTPNTRGAFIVQYYNNPVVPGLSIQGADTLYRVYSDIFAITKQPGVNYNWSSDLATIVNVSSGTDSAEVLYGAYGQIVVKVNADLGYCQTADVTKTVKVDSLTINVFPGFQQFLLNTMGNTIHAQTNNAPVNSYTWAMATSIYGPYSEITDSNANTYTPFGFPADTFYVVCIAANNSDTVTSITSMYIVDPLLSVSVAPADSQVILVNTDGNVLSATVNKSVTYQWKYATVSGGPYTNLASTFDKYTPNFSTADTFYVLCEATAGTETVNSNEVKIFVNLPVHVSSIKKEPVLIYPNPSLDGIVNVKTSAGQRIDVTDVLGNRVLSVVSSKEIEQIYLPVGMYFVNVNSISKKIVVVHK